MIVPGSVYYSEQKFTFTSFNIDNVFIITTSNGLDVTVESYIYGSKASNVTVRRLITVRSVYEVKESRLG